MKKLAFYIFILITVVAKGQQSDNLIQFSGLVVTIDSLRALPLVAIRIKGTNKGSYSDQTGFFSLVAKKGDVILFSFLGLKTVEYQIPLNLEQNKYSIIQPMSEDTVFLPETYIRGWPTQEEFNYYFVNANVPDGGYDAARGNLRKKNLSNISAGMTYDSKEVSKQTVQDQYARYYYNNQLAPQRIFDPFAWGQFFNAWKRGDYQKK